MQHHRHREIVERLTVHGVTNGGADRDTLAIFGDRGVEVILA